MNKQTLRTIVLGGLFLIPFVPFLVSSSFFFPFITTKAFAWRFIVEIVFACWLILALLDKAYRPKRSPILYAVGLFLLVIGLADAFGVAPYQSFWSNFERMEGYITMLHLGAFFLVATSVFREVDWKRWWNTSLVASLFMVVYGLFQLAGVTAINQGGVRVDGTLGNASYLAVYILIHIFIALLFFLRTKRGEFLRWGYGLLLLGQLFILYHTATRGAIIGLLGGLLIIAILNIRNKEERNLRRLSIGILVALALVVGGFYTLRNSQFVKSSPVLARFSTISSQELKSGGRSFVWPMALEGFKERPLLGWGQDNFPYVFQEHYSPNMFALEPWFDRAHNIFLDWMVAGGVLGIAAYLLLYVSLLYLIWKKESGDLSHAEKSVLTGLVAAYFFHNFFVFDQLVSYFLFFAILAYISFRKGGTTLWQEEITYSQVTQVATPLVVVALITTFYFVELKPMRSNITLIEGMKAVQLNQPDVAARDLRKAYSIGGLGQTEISEQIVSFSQPILTSSLSMDEKNAFYSFGSEVVRAEADKSPKDAKKQLLAGSFLSGLGAMDEGLVYLNKAKTLMPNKQAIYFEIGSAYINKGDFTGALKAFKEAYDLAPAYEEAKIIYLLGSIYAGDRNLEEKLKKEIPEKTFSEDPRIQAAYKAVGR
ncbi:O-antigen ligase family protein [Candidatus Parcubacteria bacterium]|nr:O-antigen ligase family protein [Candidatus Parcubacteria bacterium]